MSAAPTPLRLYAVQPRDTMRWVAVASGAAPDEVVGALASAGLAHDAVRWLADHPGRDAPVELQVFDGDEARALMPEGWHYDDLTRCWRAPGEALSWCGTRWVRIMYDYGADGVWDIEGASTVADDLPITPALAARLRAWQAVYDDHDELDGPPLDHAPFAAEGLAIARAVKAELPNWTVVYFDESRAGRGLPRSAFEYEISTSDPLG